MPGYRQRLSHQRRIESDIECGIDGSIVKPGVHYDEDDGFSDCIEYRKGGAFAFIYRITDDRRCCGARVHEGEGEG